MHYIWCSSSFSIHQERQFLVKQQQENEDFHRTKVEEHRKIIFNREMDFLNKKHDLIKGTILSYRVFY